MLNVNYNEQIGWYKMYNAEGELVTIKLCKANCLWAEMNFYTLDKDCRQGKKGERIAELVGFANDIQHLKNVCKYNAERLKNVCKYNAERPNEEEIKAKFIPIEYTFYAAMMTTELWKAIKILVKFGYIVTIR